MEGTSCVAGVCVPAVQPTVVAAIDPAQQYQVLEGIGASIGYVFDEISQHPKKAALFDAMFGESGFNVLRLRNVYTVDGTEDLASTTEIVAAATERMAQAPVLLLNSASPPASLKANGSTWCEGSPETCTLAKLADGSFDYAGFADYWRSSLDAYWLAGITPTYLSIQNNPNWVPGVGTSLQACRFLPTEGTTTVATDAGAVDVEYPGYAEALDAVVAQLAGLAVVPKIIAPSTSGTSEVGDYVAAMDMTQVDAIAHHLYGIEPAGLDESVFADLGSLAREQARPIFQTESSADALATAILMHTSFVTEGATVYAQAGFTASASSIEIDETTPIQLTAEDFQLRDPYYVMTHYSTHIAPGWARVKVELDIDAVLASAWTDPTATSTAIVITNPNLSEQVVRIDSGEAAHGTSTVYRTVLAGIERSVSLGPIPADGTVTLPGQSVATVVLEP